jgi:hypothetical protein
LCIAKVKWWKVGRKVLVQQFVSGRVNIFVLTLTFRSCRVVKFVLILTLTFGRRRGDQTITKFVLILTLEIHVARSCREFDFLFEDHCRGSQNNNKVCFGLDVTKFGSRRLFGFGFTLKNED